MLAGGGGDGLDVTIDCYGWPYGWIISYKADDTDFSKQRNCKREPYLSVTITTTTKEHHLNSGHISNGLELLQTSPPPMEPQPLPLPLPLPLPPMDPTINCF